MSEQIISAVEMDFAEMELFVYVLPGGLPFMVSINTVQSLVVFDEAGYRGVLEMLDVDAGRKTPASIFQITCYVARYWNDGVDMLAVFNPRFENNFLNFGIIDVPEGKALLYRRSLAPSDN